ncbi:MAG: hypothetical protein Kow0047_33630 [Anaerolineae bacterium]
MPLLTTTSLLLVALFAVLLHGTAVWSSIHVNILTLSLASAQPPYLDITPDAPCRSGVDPTAVARLAAAIDRARRAGAASARLALVEGHLACLQGDLPGALQAWERALRARPGDPVAAYFTALAGFAVGRPVDVPWREEIASQAMPRAGRARGSGERDVALAWYRFALALRPDLAAAEALAGLYRERDELEQAKRTWQSVIDRLPAKDPDHWWAQGQLAELEGAWDAAARAYETGATLADPSRADRFYFRAGDMWQRARDDAAAEGAFRQVLEVRPDHVDAMLRLGHLARSQRAYDVAEAWYRRAAEAVPDRYDPVAFLGVNARERGDHAAALAYLDRALEIRPGVGWVLYHKALALDALDRRAEAIQALEEAVAAQANPAQSWVDLLAWWRKYPRKEVDPNFWWAVGQEQERAREWEIAAALYRRGAEVAQPPDDLRLRVREALMYRYLKQPERAEAIYRDLAARYPEAMEPYMGLGDLARERGDYDQAASWYQRAWDVAPEEIGPPYYLGVTAYAAKEPERALAYLDQALARRPDHAWSHYYRALSLKALGRDPEANAALRTAIEKHGSPPKAWLDLLSSWEAAPEQTPSE